MQAQNYQISIPPTSWDYARMANQNDAHNYADVGERLALARRVLGITQVELAKRMRWQPSRLSNWEVGASLIPPQELRRLKQIVPGLSSDWVYDGEANRLTVEFLDRLNSLPPEEEEPTKKRGRPRKVRG